MQWIVFPLAFSVAGAYAFGPVGFACGFAGQMAWLVIAGTCGWFLSCRDALDFPLMLPHEREQMLTRISVDADAKGASEASARVRALAAAHLSEGDRHRIDMALVAEEVVVVIGEANKGRHVRVELTADFSNAAVPRLIVRDDGHLFNTVDPDQKLKSMSAYVITCVVTAKARSTNLTTSGYNRSVLLFTRPK